MQSFSINNDNRPTTFTDIHSKQLMLIDLTNLNSTKYFPNASVNSSSAHPPPRANPRALAFLKKNGQIPRGGAT